MIENEETSTFKVLCVGDGGVGKTCLLVSYAENRLVKVYFRVETEKKLSLKSFPDEYIPTVFDNYKAVVSHRDRIVELDIWDTAGQGDYGKLRKLSYPETDLFLLCFSVVQPDSWDNVVEHWSVELMEEHWSKNPCVILVGCKCDLRSDPLVLNKLKRKGLQPITPLGGRRLADTIDADAYVETSSKTLEGVKELFTKGIDLMVRRECRLMVIDLENSRIEEEAKKKKKKKKKKGWFFGNISDCDCECDMTKFL